jgi:hypothetical protein
MRNLTKLATAALTALLMQVVPWAEANAWGYHIYKSTQTPLATTYLHGGPVTSIWAYAMSGCSGGTWTKFTAIYNGPAVVHNHQYQGTGCVTRSNSHSHPGSYAVCRSVSTGSYNYANCLSGH